jgi:hypothetical protein
MAAVVLFGCFTVDLANGVHDFTTHAFKVALTDTAPTASTDTVFADIVEIAAGNNYAAGGADIPLNSPIAGPPVPIEFSDTVAVEPIGGLVGPFRYVVFYNSTAPGSPLIGYADYESSISIPEGSIFYLIGMTPFMTIEVV